MRFKETSNWIRVRQTRSRASDSPNRRVTRLYFEHVDFKVNSERNLASQAALEKNYSLCMVAARVTALTTVNAACCSL